MKRSYMKILLVALPVLAVALATTRDSVTVFSAQTGVTEYYSYFDLIPNTDLQMVTPLAAILSLVSCVLSILYAITEKGWSLKGCLGTSFCAATVAVVPVLLRQEMMIVPNVGVPILMIVHCLVAASMRKQAQTNTQEAPRLGR